MAEFDESEVSVVVEEFLNEASTQSAEIYKQSDYVTAMTTSGLRVNPSETILEGWVTYSDRRLGKIYFRSTKLDIVTGLCAVGGGQTETTFLKPNLINGKTGGFITTGVQTAVIPTGTGVLDIHGNKLPTALLGFVVGGWLVRGEVNFTHHPE